jgi:membrane-associated phospholipid phosphatase
MAQFVTDLGDSTLLIPASALVVAYLLYLRATKSVALWVVTLGLCAALTVAAKIGLTACGAGVPLLDLRSPSGHTSLSTTFYMCSALMISADKGRWTRLSLLSGTVALIAAIAVSRVMLHAHTFSEVATGFLIGICCVTWFGARYLGHPPLALRWQPFVIAVCLLAVLVHGWHLNFESLFADLAHLLRRDTGVCA